MRNIHRSTWIIQNLQDKRLSWVCVCMCVYECVCLCVWGWVVGWVGGCLFTCVNINPERASSPNSYYMISIVNGFILNKRTQTSLSSRDGCFDGRGVGHAGMRPCWAARKCFFWVCFFFSNSRNRSYREGEVWFLGQGRSSCTLPMGVMRTTHNLHNCIAHSSDAN